jgi:cytochrome c-type biogenesis protein CcmF
VNAALGTGGVVLALVGSLGAIVTLAVGLRGRRSELMRMSRTYAFMVLGGAVLAVAAMQRALITRDFSLEYVANNGSSTTPALYNVATMWAALEGSILLWGLILAGFTVAVVMKFRDRLNDPLVAWAMLVMFVVCLFFFGLMLGPANPFRVLADPPLDGPGPTRSCRTTRSWRSTRPCCTWATWASPCRSPSRWLRWSPAGSARAGWWRRGAGR